jgi:two-component system, chemotaxis family, CheB/CheR fusion protein
MAKKTKESATAGGKNVKSGKPARKTRNAGGEKTHVPKTSGFPVVCIGASAGGLDAIYNFFDNMPGDSGMAFVVVTHLDPSHESMLPNLIQNHTPMMVLRAETGIPVQPDTVYVIPPDHDLGIMNGGLKLLDHDTPFGAKAPINTFLKFLADDQKEYGVAVILSGMGSDGTLGVQAVKGEMGMVMAQDPGTAAYGSMPESAIGTGLVDYVLAPEDMPGQLISYMKSYLQGAVLPSGMPAPIEKNDLEKIHMLLRSVTGFDFSGYKENTIIRRVNRRIFVHQIDSVSHYLSYLQKNPEEVKALFKELLIGVTSFFRDPEAFASLKGKLAREMLKEKPSGSTIRAWAIGCSTGEEAYSLAMTLVECREELKRELSIQVFATDIDEAAIEKARRGLYPASISADVDPQRLEKYFDQVDNMFQVKRFVREMLVFAPQSVIKDPPFTKLDLISCRNLLIYLSTSLQKRLIPIFHFCLNPGGILFLGSSETIGDFPELFSPRDAKWKIYTRKETHSAAYPLPDFPMPSLMSPRGEPKQARDRTRDLTSVIEKDIWENHTPRTVVIDRRGDIVYIHGRTGKYLDPAVGMSRSSNIFEMAREGLRGHLVALIRRASEHKGETFSKKVMLELDGQPFFVNVKLLAMNEPSAELYMVFFEEQPIEEEKKPEAGKGKASWQEERALENLRQELQFTKESLQSTIEELEASNEEYQSTNEELQSTNEEMNSSKEELQSLNEELGTVNEELHEKIREVQHSFIDMRNFLNSLDIPVVFLDSAMRVRRFNKSSARIINLIESDIGREISHLTTNLSGVDIPGISREVLQTLQEKKLEVQSRDGRWFMMRVQPYRSPDKRIDGVILSFVDIHELRTALDQLKTSEERLKTTLDQLESSRVDLRGAGGVLSSLEAPMLVLDEGLRVVTANAAFYRTFGTSAGDTLGVPLAELQGGSWGHAGLKGLLQEAAAGTRRSACRELELDLPGMGKQGLFITACAILHDERDGSGRVLMIIGEGK